MSAAVTAPGPSQDVRPVRRALVSVYDKTGLEGLVRGLHEAGVALVSTGGSAALIESLGLPVTKVEDLTGFPECLEGRVKTLHPKVHAGILADTRKPDHVAQLADLGVEAFELVVVNLYPFAATVASGASLDECVEQIDIGGPSMVRAAAKNWPHVGIVVDPADYASVLAELDGGDGALSDATRFGLMRKAFAHTAAYDGAIANWLTARDADGTAHALPDSFHWAGAKVQDMRYGENPHQSAAFYRDEAPVPGTIATYRQLQGKELSYNNIADTDAALECVKQFTDGPACVIVKHANPCGVAEAANLADAYDRAFATDTESAFGGIIAFNRE